MRTRVTIRRQKMKMLDKKLQEQYIKTFPLLLILFVLNLALYMMSSKLLIYGFFIIGVLEFIFAKKRCKSNEIGFLLNFLITSFLLIPGFVAVLFNNSSIGFPIGLTALLILLSVRIYLMVGKVGRSEKGASLPRFISVEVLILLLLNVYLINFYNYQNKIVWKTEVSSGITSKLKISDNQIQFLTNDDFLINKFYNFPQTYILDKKDGVVVKKDGGYEFPEEFKPFKETIKDLTIDGLSISVSGDNLYIRDGKTNEVIFKFIAGGEIVSTPILEGNILYFATNGEVFLDKVKRTEIYALDVGDQIKQK
jgi:hypothetical protein